MVTFEDLKSGRVRLEFGNLEHIRAIRKHQEQQELCSACEGEGVISHVCDQCDGTGKKQVK